MAVMEPLEYFVVDSEIPSEALIYRDIIADIMSDLRLASAIGRIRVEIVPKKALFTMAVLLRDIEIPVRVSDMSKVETAYEGGKGFVRLSIEREKYMPELTRFLWDRYTPANVNQADRWTILVSAEDPVAEVSKIQNEIIANPSQSLHANLIEFAIRSMPEGFRVRYHTFENNEFMFVASEDILEKEWLARGKQMVEELKTVKVGSEAVESGQPAKQPGSREAKLAEGKGKRERVNREEEES
ncbi:methanogenesis marker 17 protein [Methanolapillus millepedarum]|uniref:Methanogenesis marker 17 protein n=1 Tax=Methanolapillus millepedarum TaxID=3028296 RepID=A0AA96ZU56_9EURY|nr:hypothetical protein MsAc7_08750 [Methanosarcinaceae archaeon Ac7]